jgi:choline kinase
MGEETALKPKCLTVLRGKPLLHWQLQALNMAGITDITVVRGYRADMIQGHFDTVDNLRWNETNMVSSLFCVKPDERNTIISYADIVYRPSHISDLMEADGDIAITADRRWKSLWELRFENPLEDAETFKSKNNVLIEVGEKSKKISDIEAQYMGLLKLTPKGWADIQKLYASFSDERKDKMDMTSMLKELIKKEIEIHVVFVDGGWCEADNYSDIEVYEKMLDKPSKWEHDWR